MFNSITPGNTSQQRKRGRETSAATTEDITPPITPFSLQQQQSQPPQLIDLSQLHNHLHLQNPNVVSTGLRLSFGDQQQPQQFQQHHNQQHHHSSALFSALTEDFATHIKHQRDELDQFLQAQVLLFPLLKWVPRILQFHREKRVN